MCVNDLIVAGGEPLFFLDYYATGKLTIEEAATVVESIAEGKHNSQCYCYDTMCSCTASTCTNSGDIIANVTLSSKVVPLVLYEVVALLLSQVEDRRCYPSSNTGLHFSAALLQQAATTAFHIYMTTDTLQYQRLTVAYNSITLKHQLSTCS
jgi:hypothetical protein